MTKRVCLTVLIVCSPVLMLAGCEDKAKTLSEYPYFVEKLNGRWVVIRKAFASETPKAGVGFCSILLRDIKGTRQAMERSYNGPNRKAGVEKISAVYKTLYTELHSQVSMLGGPPTLKRGATVEGVRKSIEKAYVGYQEFQQMVKLD